MWLQISSGPYGLSACLQFRWWDAQRTDLFAVLGRVVGVCSFLVQEGWAGLMPLSPSICSPPQCRRLACLANNTGPYPTAHSVNWGPEQQKEEAARWGGTNDRWSLIPLSLTRDARLKSWPSQIKKKRENIILLHKYWLCRHVSTRAPYHSDPANSNFVSAAGRSALLALQAEDVWSYTAV